MYIIIFDEEAINFLSKLPLEIKKRIYDKITSTKDIPHHYFERLKGKNEYKLRIGDYRLLLILTIILKKYMCFLSGIEKMSIKTCSVQEINST